jgi:virulence factor Mce-like protein
VSDSRRLGPLALGAVAVVVIVALALTVFRAGSQRTVRAEFQDVRGLLAGNEVLDEGARVGSVGAIGLTDHGTAMVTMHIDRGIPAPRADATATVRPVDLLGDIYLDYSPGTSGVPLSGPIPLGHTMNVPRLSDLLLAFTPGARAGAQALIVELAAGLENRGFDLNRAALALRPAFVASDRVTGQLASQNASLESLIVNSNHLLGQLAQRTPDVSGMVDGFSRTLRATATHAPQLDRGLARLAPTIGDLRDTTAALASAANQLQPLATQLGRVAPPLTQSMELLSPFLAQTRSAVATTRPTIRDAARFLSAAQPSLTALTSGISTARTTAPSSDSLLQTLDELAPLVADDIFQDVASQTSEPGNQPAAPGTDPLRHYWRGAAVLSCETFGLKITPGCAGALPGGTAQTRRPPSISKRPTPTHPAAPSTSAPPTPAAGPHPTAPGGLVQQTVQTVSNVASGVLAPAQHAVQQVVGTITQAVGTGAPPASSGSSGSSAGGNAVSQLMNYLLGP